MKKPSSAKTAAKPNIPAVATDGPQASRESSLVGENKGKAAPKGSPVPSPPSDEKAKLERDSPGLESSLPEHLALLPGCPAENRWALWRWIILRGAGFPVSALAGLSFTNIAAADRLLDLETDLEAKRRDARAAVNQALDDLRSRGEWSDKSRRKPLLKAQQALAKGKQPKAASLDSCNKALAALEAAVELLPAQRQAFAEAYSESVLRCSAELRRVAGWDPFREAVVWQNRRAVETALTHLAARPPTAQRNSQHRQHEELAANYLQRYCAKNDTIGFFGPVGWARWVDEGKPVLTRPGDQTLARREVFFENWGIDALAAALSRDLALRPWLAPRLKPSFYLEGLLLHRALGPPQRLPPAEARLLGLCDGEHSARSIAAELLADPALELNSEAEVLELLDSLLRRKVIVWRLEVALELYPENSLRRQLERIEPEDLRRPCLKALDELDGARHQVAAAAGNAQALDQAMRSLENSFTRLTGLSAHRRSGQMYASRGLVYEDCRRDAEVEFGPEMLNRLGPPLGQVLRSARWVTTELYRRVSARLLDLHAELCAERGADQLSSHLFFMRAFDRLFNMHQEKDACFLQVERAFQQRWSQILGFDPSVAPRQVRRQSSDLEAQVSENFPRHGTYWSLARYFSPDVMIAATSEAAFAAGDFQLVLGEVHTTNTLSWSCFVSQHPCRDELLTALDRDSRDLKGIVLPHLPKSAFGQRLNVSLVLPHFYRFQLADDPPPQPPCQILPGSHLLVEKTSRGLRVISRDRRLDFDVIELFGFYLCEVCNDIIGQVLPPARHQPRVEIDHLVISREKWRFKAEELEFSAIKDPSERFMAVRRWARQHGIPRYSFYKLAAEVKPCYLDLDSPIFVDIFAKMLRNATAPDESVSVSEMLPSVDQAWLRDSAGELYTSELRIAAVEPL